MCLCVFKVFSLHLPFLSAAIPNGIIMNDVQMLINIYNFINFKSLININKIVKTLMENFTITIHHGAEVMNKVINHLKFK